MVTQGVYRYVKSGSLKTASCLVIPALLLFSVGVSGNYVEVQDGVKVQFHAYKNIIIGADSNDNYQLGYGYQDKDLIVVLGIQGHRETAQILTEQLVEFTWKHRLYGFRASFIICQKSEINLSYKLTGTMDLNLKLSESPSIGLRKWF